jgi:hypothetical protein
MLRTNLSTRPFYNVRTVQLTIGLFAGIVMAITLYNVGQIIGLTASQRSLGSRATEAETEAARLRADAARMRAQVDPRELQVVANAAREANGIIDQRAFSWTTLFGEFEMTLRRMCASPRCGRGSSVAGPSSSQSRCRQGVRKTSMGSSKRWSRKARFTTCSRCRNRRTKTA